MDEVVSIYIMYGAMAQQNNLDSFLKSNTQFIKTYKNFLSQGFWYFARSRSHEIHVNPANFTKTRKIPRNSVKILSNTYLYNISETYFGYWGYLLAVNLQNLSWNFVTETCKQRPETTRRRLCCEKLGTSIDLNNLRSGPILAVLMHSL